MAVSMTAFPGLFGSRGATRRASNREYCQVKPLGFDVTVDQVFEIVGAVAAAIVAVAALLGRRYARETVRAGQHTQVLLTPTTRQVVRMLTVDGI